MGQELMLCGDRREGGIYKYVTCSSFQAECGVQGGTGARRHHSTPTDSPHGYMKSFNPDFARLNCIALFKDN